MPGLWARATRPVQASGRLLPARIERAKQLCPPSSYYCPRQADSRHAQSTENTIFDGRVIKVSVDTVDLPNGVRLPLEIVRHPGGAAAAAIDAQNRICLLRQYRHAAGGYIYELPAGKLEPDEPPDVTVKRELVEEAAVSANLAFARHVFQLRRASSPKSSISTSPRICRRRTPRPRPARCSRSNGGRSNWRSNARSTASSPTGRPSSGFCGLRHTKKLRETVHRP